MWVKKPWTLWFDSDRSILNWPVTMMFRICRQTSILKIKLLIALCSLVFAGLHSNIPKIFLVVFWVVQKNYNYKFIYFLSSSFAWLLASLPGWLHMSLQVLQWVMSIISWRMCFQSSQVVLGFSILQELCENIRRELLKPTINTHCFNLLVTELVTSVSQSVSQSLTHSLSHAHARMLAYTCMHLLAQSISQSINQFKVTKLYMCMIV